MIKVKTQRVGKLKSGKPDKRPAVWEYVSDLTKRMPVYGGWIIAEYNTGMTFVPDPKHEWIIYADKS